MEKKKKGWLRRLGEKLSDDEKTEKKEDVQGIEIIDEEKVKRYPSVYYDNLELMKKSGFIEEANRKGLIPLKSKNNFLLGVIIGSTVIILIALLFSIIFGYGIVNDKFKSDMIQNVNITTTPSDVTNQIINQYNITTPNYNNMSVIVFVNNSIVCHGNNS